MGYHQQKYKNILPERLLIELDCINENNSLNGANIDTLNLDNNNMGAFGINEWKAFGEAIKGANIGGLSLYDNNLYSLNEDTLTAFLTAITSANVHIIIGVNIQKYVQTRRKIIYEKLLLIIYRLYKVLNNVFKNIIEYLKK